MKRMKVDRDKFFASVKKSLFGGTLTQTQVNGMNAILDACEAEGFDYKPYFAGPLATAYHETGRSMKPVREGFATTDAGARAAVANLYARGKISRNYALPHKNGKSYYGRGLPQLTHGENYKEMGKLLNLPLYDDPDLMLDIGVSAKALVAGMDVGMFTSRSMRDYRSPDHEYAYAASRAIINGDKNYKMKGSKKTLGETYADYCRKFERAIEFVEVEVEPLDPSDEWEYSPAEASGPSMMERLKALLAKRK